MLGLRPESLELAGDGLPARVEVVEEIGADAYVFCVADVAGEEVKLVARCETQALARARRARPPAPARRRGARLRPRDRREARRLMTGEVFLAEIREQPAALRRLLVARAGARGGRRGAGAASAERRAPRRPRHLGQRGVVRRLRVRTAPRLDGAARLDLADRLLRRGDRLRELGGRRALAVRPDAGRRRVRAAGARRRGAHDRAHERPSVRARAGGGARRPAARPGPSARSPRRRPT